MTVLSREVGGARFGTGFVTASALNVFTPTHIAAAALFLVMYVPFFKRLVSLSVAKGYAGHVIFVPIIAAMMLFIERHRLRGGTPRRLIAAAFVVVGLVTLGLGYKTGHILSQALALIVTVAGWLVWSYGLSSIRRAAFILVFLLLMIPPPTESVTAIASHVQQFVAMSSNLLLRAVQIPVEQQGLFLRLPTMTLEVAEGCAGLRFLLILCVLGAAFARIVTSTVSAQVVLALASIPIAVLANTTRVVAIAVGSYVFGPHVATGPLHYYIGKGCWLLAFAALIAIAGLLRAHADHSNGRPADPRQCLVQG
jgi:exosortase